MWFLILTGWEAKRLKGCIFSPPSLLPVSGRGKEARKRNLSIASNPVSVRNIIGLTCEHGIFWAEELDPARAWIVVLVDAVPPLILHVHRDLLALPTRLSFEKEGKVQNCTSLQFARWMFYIVAQMILQKTSVVVGTRRSYFSGNQRVIGSHAKWEFVIGHHWSQRPMRTNVN